MHVLRFRLNEGEEFRKLKKRHGYMHFGATDNGEWHTVVITEDMV